MKNDNLKGAYISADEMRGYYNMIIMLEPVRNMSIDELNKLYSDVKKTDEYRGQKNLFDSIFNVAINENELINSEEFSRFSNTIKETYL